MCLLQPETAVGCSQGKEVLFGLQLTFMYDKAGLASVSVVHCSPGNTGSTPHKMPHYSQTYGSGRLIKHVQLSCSNSRSDIQCTASYSGCGLGVFELNAKLA